MFVIKRDGSKQQVKLEKIQKRIKISSKGLDRVDVDAIAQKVVAGLYDGVSSKELDMLAVETAAYMSAKEIQYDKLAVRLAVSSLHKETESSFSTVIEKLYNNKNGNGNPKPYIAEDVYKIIKKNAKVLDSAVVYDRDYLFDYFGFKTLEKSYLLKVNRVIVERPQHMWLRVSIGIHKTDIDAAIQTYHKLSTLEFIHATPTLFNAGMPKNQMSSCFLLQVEDDSIKGIFNTLEEVALISQSSGGIGISFSNIRSRGSPIYGTNGNSNGIIPFLKIYEQTAKSVDQGGGRRKGSFAIYLEPWHADILDFLDIRKNNGKEEMRARDLNIAMWIPDLFMQRVEKDEMWTLMDPNKCSGLYDSYGEEFENRYLEYEKNNKGEKTIKAREVWQAIMSSQIETGEPYILFKDACIGKSNQRHMIGEGRTLCSNLCSEILEVVGPEDTSVCNLASISLKSCVEGKKGSRTFNYDKLEENTRILTQNINKIIDENFYPVEKAKKTNLRDRPIGIGVQGLADTLALMGYSWDSQEAKELNKNVFETMYYGFVCESILLAKKQDPYDSYKGSPTSKGKLQFDLWNIKPSSRYNWEKVKENLEKHGMRNSLGIAIMPTASTSQIIGNTESIEMITSNMYKRNTLSGEFMVINKYLVEDLMESNLWNESIRQQIVSANGSIQNITEIPQNIKNLYKTAWENSQKIVIDMAADRGPFVCQTQSMNLYMKEANFSKLTTALFMGWKLGLKTGVYYVRQQSATEAAKFTVDVVKSQTNTPIVSEETIEVSKAIAKLQQLGTTNESIKEMYTIGGNKLIIETARGACSIADPGSCDMCSG